MQEGMVPLWSLQISWSGFDWQQQTWSREWVCLWHTQAFNGFIYHSNLFTSLGSAVCVWCAAQIEFQHFSLSARNHLNMPLHKTRLLLQNNNTIVCEASQFLRSSMKSSISSHQIKWQILTFSLLALVVFLCLCNTMGKDIVVCHILLLI